MSALPERTSNNGLTPPRDVPDLPDSGHETPTPARGPKLTAKANPSCEIELTVETPFSVTVALKELDLTHWMDQCRDVAALRRLARYANYCANSIEAQEAPGHDATDPHFRT